jgi:hypothetical protein
MSGAFTSRRTPHPGSISVDRDRGGGPCPATLRAAVRRRLDVDRTSHRLMSRVLVSANTDSL